MISNRFVSRFFFHWYEKLCSLAVPLGVREPWKKAVITCTGWNFTFFVVFQCLECRLNCWSCMSSFFSGLRQWVFFPMFAHSFTSIFPFFSFLKNLFFRSCFHTHTPNNPRQRWKTRCSCFIPVKLIEHNCHLDSSSAFPPFPPKLFYFTRNKYPLHIWLRGKSGDDSSFYLDKFLDSVVPWAGFYGDTRFIQNINYWNDSWEGLDCTEHWGTTIKQDR